MAVQKTRRAPTLRTNILLLMLCGFAVVAFPAYWAFNTLVTSTVAQLGTLFAEKQILFDRYRGLDALRKEVALAETLSRSPVIADWAEDETDPAKQGRAIAELEQYRQSFSDHSYFFVVNASGNYYYNDAQNSHAGKQLSFTVRRDNPSDDWYYATIALDGGCHLNVDHDDELSLTKVFINCIVRDSTNKVLGVLGTGIDLSAFIKQVVDLPQPGVQAMFIDRAGAIQAHRDVRYIDFHSLTKTIETRKSIFSLLDTADDRAALKQMLDEVTTGNVEVRSRVLQIDGRQMLVGVGYLDGLGWYNVTVMDVDKIIDKSLFLPIGLLLAAMMIIVALVIAFIVKLSVVDRINQVEKGVVAVKQDSRTRLKPDRGKDEIGRLSRSIASMATSVQDNMRMLEDMVEERTAELQTLAYRDQLTGIANRRGFADGFERMKAAAAPEARLALLLIDIDRFKDINDGHGHQAGDEVAAEMARRIATVLRPADICARWGGDEFIVLFSDLGSRPLKLIADAVKRGLSQPVELKGGRTIPVTVSIGACLVEPAETLDQVADMADAALYAAKEDGRDRVSIFDPTRPRSAAGQLAS
jgi:diguanylate cyclase (GGDEF)-like protein